MSKMKDWKYAIKKFGEEMERNRENFVDQMASSITEELSRLRRNFKGLQ